MSLRLGSAPAMQRVLFRRFLSPYPNTILLAFITYIRPVFDYNSILWNPNLVCLLDLIENVQHKFTRPVPSLSSSPYSERLALLDRELLELRRFRFDII